MSDDTISNEEQPRPSHLFAPGNNANPAGRPKGSRNKLGEAFIAAMHADFETHGATVIEKVRTTRPDQYLKVIASIVPKELNVRVSELDMLSDEELDGRITAIAAALHKLTEPAGSVRVEAAAGESARGEEAPARPH